MVRRQLSAIRPAWLRIPEPSDFRSPVHDERVVARLGMFLGAAILILFVTGLVSHLHQHPVPWLPFGPEPAWAYRLNQGLHVAVGFASLPLVLAKLYTVYPQLFVRPPVTGWKNALERASVGVLVAAMVFQVVTGILNVFKLYVFGFSFTSVHYATAWLAFGAAPVPRRAGGPDNYLTPAWSCDSSGRSCGLPAGYAGPSAGRADLPASPRG